MQDFINRFKAAFFGPCPLFLQDKINLLEEARKYDANVIKNLRKRELDLHASLSHGRKTLKHLSQKITSQQEAMAMKDMAIKERTSANKKLNVEINELKALLDGATLPETKP